MGDVGEVTASTLSADQDVIDMQAEGKRGLTDYSSMEAEIDALTAQAAKVLLRLPAILPMVAVTCAAAVPDWHIHRGIQGAPGECDFAVVKQCC